MAKITSKFWKNQNLRVLEQSLDFLEHLNLLKSVEERRSYGQFSFSLKHRANIGFALGIIVEKFNFYIAYFQIQKTQNMKVVAHEISFA